MLSSSPLPRAAHRVCDGPGVLGREDYERFRTLVHEQTGISLGEHKVQLLRARLGRLLRAGGFRSFRAYYEHVRADPTGAALDRLIDAISTNTTHLFRERQHFMFLAERLRELRTDAGWRAAHDPLRIWSAACSSGEEPYSIAMTVADVLSPAAAPEFKILATDISARMLARARTGVFETSRLGTVPAEYRGRFFERAPHGDPLLVRIIPGLRRRISFHRFNLVAARFPFRHGFDFVFCRNVMIYFDRPTQAELVRKLTQHIRPGGYLFVGHAEGLNALRHSLEYVRPAVYRRTEA